jgi:hypothetical protein
VLVERADHRAIAQYSYAVSDAHHLAEAVSDVKDGRTIGSSGLHPGQQHICIVLIERGGRLVEYQHGAFAGKRTGQLRQPQLRDTELTGDDVRSEVCVDPVECRLGESAIAFGQR